MKKVSYNEIHTLLPHIREALLTGRRRYRDQVGSVNFENANTRDLMAGLIKHRGGVKEGYMPARKPGSTN